MCCGPPCESFVEEISYLLGLVFRCNYNAASFNRLKFAFLVCSPLPTFVAFNGRLHVISLTEFKIPPKQVAYVHALDFIAISMLYISLMKSYKGMR